MKKNNWPIKKIGKTAGALLLAGSVFLCACEKQDPQKKGNKKKHSTKTTTVSETDPQTGRSDPADTFRIDAKLWSADIPIQYMYDKGTCIDEDDETYYAFMSDPNHPDFDYFYIYIITESAEVFRKTYQYDIPMDQLAKGTLPMTNLAGCDFYEFETYHFGTEIDSEETHYVCRYEAASMTIELVLGENSIQGTSQVRDIMRSIEFNLPDLGLTDPPFAFEQGEFQTTVQELPLGQFKVTPRQGHFSEHVFITSSNGFVPFSSTACYVVASEKYLYTCESGLVHVYLINGDEMTKIGDIVAGCEVVTMDLLDGDTVTFYPDSDPQYMIKFFFVETVNGNDRVLSVLDDVVVSPDGQHILYHNPLADQMHMLYLDPVTKVVTSEPFSFSDVPLDAWDLQYVFMTDSCMYARFSSYAPSGSTFHLLQYDFDGNLIGEVKDDTLENMYTYSLYEFGEYILVADQGEDTLRLMDENGNTVDSVKIGDLIGIPSGNLTHYSFLKVNDEGDFLLVYAYDHDGVLEDLVFNIHIG